MQYNLIVIGAGSGGLVSAYIAAAVKAKVALIEKHRMGGDCLNTGCVPSKALIRTAAFLSHVRRHRDFGIREAHVHFDFAEVMERVQRVIQKIEPHDSVERYTSLGVDCIQGEARILSPHEVRVNGKVLTTQNIIIATGGRPIVPSIPGLDKIKPLHSDNVWNLRQKPGRLVVMGGGPIGCELAQCFARLGVRVIQVQKAPHLLMREDDDVAGILLNRFKEEGVEEHMDTSAREVVVRDGKKILSAEKHGNVFEIPFDEILVAVGRKPNVKGFGLEELGIGLDKSGRIRTDAFSRTNIKNIFACGDVTSPYQFTHMAAHQAWYASVNALFGPFKKFRVDLTAIPWCTFTDPEIARVGLNEKDARALNIPCEAAIYPLNDLDRAIADSETEGLVKVLTPPGKDKILGVTICGFHAGDLLPEFVMAKKFGHGLNQILGTIHTYPTMAEANKYAAGVWKKAHQPVGLLKLIQTFHAIRRRCG